MTKARDIASAIPAPSTVSSAELGHLDGVTSAIQTQVDAKTAKATLTTKGDIYAASAASTPTRLGVGGNGETLVADSSTSTGLRYNPTVAAGKNRIINGAMSIDQRNNGASVATTGLFPVDRTRLSFSGGGVITGQRSTTAPSGFRNSLYALASTADASVAAGDFYALQQFIEGSNAVDLSFGTASAKTVTISFWVQASITGTYCVAITNSANARSYVAEYSISVANTWEYKSVTIEGDTSGTWPTDTGQWGRIRFSLGGGANSQTTAGAWSAGNFYTTSNQVNWIGTLNATLYLTGVQLELGSVATAFSNAGGTFQGELAACQRYFQRYVNGADQQFESITSGQATSTTNVAGTIRAVMPMRVAPTASVSSGGHFSCFTAAAGVNVTSAITFEQASPRSIRFSATTTGMVAGNSSYFLASSTSATLDLSSEL